jgi:hypothetical protein
VKLAHKVVIGVGAVLLAGLTAPEFIASESLQFFAPIVIGTVLGLSIMASERYPESSPI